jgi:ribosomal protein L21E
VEELFQERTTYSELLKNRLATTQNQMKIPADKHRLDREFQVGDKVLLKLQPYVQNSMVSRSHPKLAFKFLVPS